MFQHAIAICHVRPGVQFKRMDGTVYHNDGNNNRFNEVVLIAITDR